MSNTPANEQVNVKTAELLGLRPEEFQKIQEILGRMPNFTELSIFSVMWSEHCSYKNSITWLKTLPKDGEKMLVAAGEENAGLVDIGDGLACAFKIESHNHPSAIEPYQGAATGVGGIHRDIFTMGARPLAALNSLRFGDLSLAKTKHIVKGVVKGIGDYGNSFGVPTVAGEVFFNPSFNQNPLVNAMSVGIVNANETVSATSSGVGNPVFIVGSATGKDGIHGATFASADLTEDSAEDLPSVQVGDPFQEKLLLEASLELIQTNAIVGMQDMGAAGITCSTSEMSAKEGFGMEIDLDKVPTRQKNMKPFEILLSESQERMLIVGHKGMEKAVYDVFDKWDLPCEQIGEVTEGGRIIFRQGGEIVADVPADDLVLGGGAPVYTREYEKPAYFDKIEKFDINEIAEPKDLKAVAETLINQPNIASKKWVYEQYDSMVRTNTATTNLKSDAAIIRIKGTNKALCATVDCNSSMVYADPFMGAQIAVAEAARNVICSGGEPSAVTNCLNFGNPYNPQAYYQFAMAVKGMGEACKKFNTPVTGGNVSFYNQSQEGDTITPVYPTPTIGMLGVMEDINNAMDSSFKNEGDLIYLLGESQNCIGSSEYVRAIHNVEHSNCPNIDLDKEILLQQTTLEAIKGKLILSAHDCADGGLFVALVESCFANNKGFEIDTTTDVRQDAYLFGEAPSRIVVSVSKDNQTAFEALMNKNGLTTNQIGTVTNGTLAVNKEDWGTISTWKEQYDTALGKIMEA